MHDTSLRRMRVAALICWAVLVSWPAMGDELFLGGSGLGIRQPFGLAVITPCAENTSAGGELYLQTFDFVADHTQAYAVTWDRLLLVDVQTGTAEDLGRFEYGQGYRWNFGLDLFDPWPNGGVGSHIRAILDAAGDLERLVSWGRGHRRVIPNHPT